MMLLCFISGLGGVTSWTIRISATQSYVPDAKKGRFNGAFNMLFTAGALIGEFAAGALSEIFPERNVLLGSMLLCGLAAVIFIGGGKKYVAPIYNRIPLRIRLRGANEYLFTTDADVREWLPGEREVLAEIALPCGMQAGEYEVAVTLSGDNTPVVRWETQGEWDGAFLSIGSIRISNATKANREDRKAYLSDFLGKFGYSDEAKRALEGAFDAAHAEQDAVALFEEIRARFEAAPDEKFKYLIEASKKIAAKCAINEYTSYLLVLILLSESSRKVYAERGVSAEMWRRNMLDLKYMCDICVLLKGVYGIACPDWYARFFAATRFTFGKLQFETGCLGKPYRKDDVALGPDDTVIYIHIPRTGKRLLPEDVDAACAEASAFYRQRYGIEKVVFACHTWILYPENKKILSEKSNLYSFISRFEVIDVEEDTAHKELWRLFDREYNGNPDDLPQDTSLRRAYVQRLKENKPLGVALGVWVYRQ